MSKFEAKWLDMKVHSLARAHSVALAVSLYYQHRTMEKMYAAYMKAQRQNKEGWDLHRQWIKQIPSGVWPNGQKIEDPGKVILTLKVSSLQREMKRVGVSIPRQKARFQKYELGETNWRLVAEKEKWESKVFSRYNASHIHNGLPYLSGYWEIIPGRPMGQIDLGKCIICGDPMPKLIEAWMRMNRLGEKLDG